MAHLIPSLFLLLLLLPSPSSATAGNLLLLLTGDTLPLNSDILSFPINPSFNNHTLNLTDSGQLQIQTPDGSTRWSSSPPTKTGRYAAVFRADGHATVYGPRIWTTPPAIATRAPAIAHLPHSPNSRNLMFSSQVLDDGAKLASGEHSLVMSADCNLELVRASSGVVWESGTKGIGRNCCAVLDHRGRIAVVDGRLKVVWATKGGEEDGFYVLVVQNDGGIAVYGPAIWSSSFVS